MYVYVYVVLYVVCDTNVSDPRSLGIWRGVVLFFAFCFFVCLLLLLLFLLNLLGLGDHISTVWYGILVHNRHTVRAV